MAQNASMLPEPHGTGANDDVLPLIGTRAILNVALATPAHDPVARQPERRVQEERRGLGVLARRKEDAERRLGRGRFLLSYFGQLDHTIRART